MADNLDALTRQIEKDHMDAKEFRRQAENNRQLAQTKHEDDRMSATYYEQEASKLEERAQAVEDDAKQLTQKAEQIRARVSELETERTNAEKQHQDTMARIDAELKQLTGGTTLL